MASNCELCATRFLPHRNTQRFCSVTCANTSRNQPKPEPPEPGVDYTALHPCPSVRDEVRCGGALQLRTFPVDAGFVVAVCCNTCRTNGLPTRYSTETDAFPTFDAAELCRAELVGGTV